MIINLFTDPHLNVSRQAHTTPQSSKELNQRLYEFALKAKSDTLINYCLGDLFDKSFNPEWAVIQGIEVAKDCYVLAGNHDETNREGTKCSLEVVKASGLSKVVRNPSVSKAFYVKTDEGVYMVPHHASQEDFVVALEAAAEDSKGEGVLMVHCNRGEIMGPAPDSILVISKEEEDKLLQSFKRIFYGHEHSSHNNEVEGDKVISRAVVLGNTHPTSFSDMSNKYRYEYNLETDELFRFPLWKKSEKFLSVKIGDSLAEGDYDFIEVTGLCSRREAADYVDLVWKTYPDALMVRPNVQFEEDGVSEVTVSEPVNLSETIAKDLEGTDMKELFIKILKDVTNGN